MIHSIAASAATIKVPAKFAADRVYARLQTKDGALTLYTDTGGGSLIISRAAAKRLHLPLKPIDDPEAKAELGDEASATIAPRLSGGLPNLPSRAFIVPYAAQVPGWPEQADGFVGAKWFENGIWTWDYAAAHLLYRTSLPQTCPGGIPISFKTEAGRRPNNFARIEVNIDGRELPMLLDTGAETLLTKAAASAIGDDGPIFRAATMLEASQFDALHSGHPGWRYIADAQVATKAAMLRVPSVRIGQIDTGPLWVTRRSDAAYRDFMSSMTDRPVVGSIGGNAFHGLIVTIDFKGAHVWIERPGASCFSQKPVFQRPTRASVRRR